MTEKKFTEELKNIFDYIQNKLIKEYDSDRISSEYFILSVLENDYCIAHKVLSKIMLHDTIENAKIHFYQWLSMHLVKINGVRQYDDIFEKCVKNAKLLAIKQKSSEINSGHILSSVILNNGEINRYFRTLGVTINQISSQVLEETNNMIAEKKQKFENNFVTTKAEKHNKKPKEDNNKIIDKILVVDERVKNNCKVEGECARITTNLNEKAYKLQIDTIYGNEDIYQEMFTILSKRNKNNVVLVGKAGVGKTETVRNLANLIVSGNVPKTFKDKILLEVDFNSLFCDTQMRGTFEAKMKTILSEIKHNGNYIFFVDSLNSVLNSHFTQNEVEEFIDTLLKDRNAMLICTCSEKGYSKQIGDNPSWGRYFEKITLEEPSEEDCIKILKQHAEKLQTFHDVQYSEDIFDTCIKYSKRYITERNLPDSAIDVIDKSGAKKSLTIKEDDYITSCRKNIEDVRNKIAVMKRNHNEKNTEELEKLIKKEIELNTSLEFAIKQHNLTKDKPLVNINDIKEGISEKTNIPVTDLSVDDKEKLKNLNNRIKDIVIGQDEAVETVCKAIKRQRVGISNPDKPVVFLMAGSTGVGKSYLAKIIAKEIFGSEKKLVRLDMAEYADKTSITKLIGTGSGYVGYDNGGILTEAIKKNKHCVLLLDEIEKADEEVHNAFLSTFDEGRLTDNKGVTIDFKNVIVVMTSNVGAREVDERGNGIGFVTNTEELKKEIIEKELKRKFKPEFINRIDKIVYFNKLTEENIKNIITLEIDKIRKRIENMGYGLEEIAENTELFNTIYSNVIKSKNMGARPIIRELQTHIEDKITDLIIDNNFETGHIFTAEELVV